MGRQREKIDSLGERIKYARNFQGFERKDLSAKSGISLGDLIDYEKGVRVPDTKILKIIGRLCRFDLYWLETGEELYPPPSDEEKIDSKA